MTVLPFVSCSVAAAALMTLLLVLAVYQRTSSTTAFALMATTRPQHFSNKLLLKTKRPNISPSLLRPRSYYSSSLLYYYGSSNNNEVQQRQQQRQFNFTEYDNSEEEYILRVDCKEVEVLSLDEEDNEEDDFDDDDDDDDLMAEMIELRNKRRAILKNPTTKYMPLTLTAFMETHEYSEAGSIVFRQGQPSTGFYFVKSGQFECIQEPPPSIIDSTGVEEEQEQEERNVVKVCQEGDCFGEIGVFLNQPRALSVRSASHNAALWHVSKDDYNLILKSQQSKKKKNRGGGAGGGDTQQNETPQEEVLLKQEYEEFIERRDQKIALRKCTLFKSKSLSDNEIDQIASKLIPLDVKPGQILIQQDSTDDEEMYFVVDGEFECYDTKTQGEIIATCKRGSYFGELALFLDVPRKLSVRASLNSTTTTTTTTLNKVWSLSRQDLFDVIDETIFDSDYFDMLQDQYRDAGMLDRVLELQQYLELRSRPQKKPVSIHSTLSIFAAGSFLQAYAPFVHPGLDHDGYIQIFDYYGQLGIDKCHQIQFSCILLAMSGIMGFFRIPPKAPPARRLPFTLATLSSILFALTGSSSLNSLPDTGYWQFDAFSPIGKVVISIPVLATSGYLLKCLDEAIAGTGEGTETVPGAYGRIPNIVLAASVCWLVQASILPFVLPIWTSDLASYQQNFASGLQACNLDGLDLHGFSTGLGFVSFLQLFSTLQFEKKISKAQGFGAFVALFFIFNVDALVARFKAESRPDLLPLQAETNYYIQNLMEEHHLIPILMGVMGMVVLNAIRKVVVRNSSDNDGAFSIGSITEWISF